MIGFIVILAIAGFSGYFFLVEEEYTSNKKLLRFNYIVKNESEKFIADVQFTVALPLYIKGIQSIESMTSSYEYETPGINTQTIEFPLKDITPYASKIIDLTLVVELTNRAKTDSEKAKKYLKAQKYIESEAIEIKALAAQLKGETATETAKNINQWLINNINLSSYTADSKGAMYLIKNKMGDCTEFMYAFVALARANDIPARGVSGFWIPGESSLISTADYHDWAEFYDGDRWILVDASKKVFDSSLFNYIALQYEAGLKRFDISEKIFSTSL